MPGAVKVEEGKTARRVESTGWDPRIEVVECDKIVRAFVVRAERHTVIIDTLLGPRSGKFLRDVANATNLLVINSHADWDHYWGNQVFGDVPILGSSDSIERVVKTSGPEELERKRSEDPESYRNVRPTPPSITFPGEARIDGLDLTFQLIPTPGHRHDHLSVWIPEIRTLFPGDCVEDPLPLLDEGSGTRYLGVFRHTLRRLIDLEPEWVFPCHAEPHRGSGLMQKNLGYLEKLHEEARASSNLDELKSRFPFPGDAQTEFYPGEHQRALEVAWKERE